MYDSYPGLNFFIKTYDADYLCLCGDIGNPFESIYKHFLVDCANSFKKVFIIAGNHEYYSSSIEHTLSQIKSICAMINPEKLIFLQNSSFQLPNNTKIIGTTLWSKLDEDQISDIRFFIADFRKITNFSIYQYEKEHKIACDFIKNEVTSNQNIIIMTHHAPILQAGNPKHYGSTLSSAFKSDLKYLFKDNIIAWFYGHDHYSNDLSFNNIKFISNQFGYPGELKNQKDCIYTI